MKQIQSVEANRRVDGGRGRAGLTWGGGRGERGGARWQRGGEEAMGRGARLRWPDQGWWRATGAKRRPMGAGRRGGEGTRGAAA